MGSAQSGYAGSENYYRFHLFKPRSDKFAFFTLIKSQLRRPAIKPSRKNNRLSAQPDLYSVVLPSKCSLSASASVRVWISICMLELALAVFLFSFLLHLF